MTITNVTDRELAVARQFEALKGVYRRDHETSQAKIEELRAEVAELKANLEKEQALTAHHRTAQVELLSKVAKLKAKLASVDKQKPVATLHDDGYWTWIGTAPHESCFAGWHMDVYAKGAV